MSSLSTSVLSELLTYSASFVKRPLRIPLHNFVNLVLSGYTEIHYAAKSIWTPDHQNMWAFPGL